MVYIYVIKLQQNKFYVGKTNNPQIRLDNHFNTRGSEWTKLYKPISIEALIPDCDDYDEDKYTRMYMDKYGIDNVRGGSYTQVNLDKTTKEHLTRMSNGTNDRCFTCGKTDHFAKDCHKNDKELDVPFENLLKSQPIMLKEDCHKNDKELQLPFENLLKYQPIMLREDYKKYIELLKVLQAYKIKVGDIILNTNNRYHTLKELLDDTDNVLNNFDEKEFSARKGMNSDVARTVKTYVSKLKIETYNTLSEILATFNLHVYNELQSNKSIPDIIKECYEMFGYKYI
jgi:hypothetical protein